MKTYHQTATEVVNVVCEAFEIPVKDKFEKKHSVITQVEQFLIQREVSTKITETHLSILKLMTEGKGAKQIGAEIFLSPRTIETHVQHMKAIFGARNSAQLVAMAKDYRLI